MLPNKLVLSVKDIQDIMGISRGAAYALVNSGKFSTIRVGKLIKISRVVFEDWINGKQTA